MKKAITILAVIAIVACAVFADNLPAQNASEEHNIRIKTTVSSVLPQFSLENGTAKTNSTENEANRFANGAQYGDPNGDIQVVNVQDISAENITTTFTAKLINEAKTAGTYTLSFSAGNFENVWKMVDGQLVKNATIAPSTTVAPSVTKATQGAAGNGITIANPVNTSIKVTFNGKVCTAGDIATYSVQYDQDENVVDNDGAGYTADITMTVTFN